MTERGQYRCTVKEGKDGKPWLLFVPWGEQLSILKHRQFGIDLSLSTTLEEARAVAVMLNHHMTGLSLSQHLRVVE